ncbi:hypothetical protein [Williamsia sterculiae]|uniref:Uncharacterized protein n=1 Tax=Williamsia sterculiae TaxID=1344003 RepID=A0A1N7DVG9_9NOCA|nr:hypothetical protein [Williamsia sterculiae]SIR79803.1 hypothetical protein SAMN05445060_0937 [Williamsia sterculiae]
MGTTADPGPVGRAPSIGAMIGAVAAVAWGIWGTRALSGTTGVVVLAVVVAVSVVVLTGAVRAVRHATGGAGPSMFRSRFYRLTVAAEIAAIAAGVAILDRVDGGGHYVAMWIAAVVAVHFAVFGVRLSTYFHRLAAALAVVVVAAIIVETVAGGSTGTAVTGVGAAVVFDAAALLTVRRHHVRRQD